MRTPRTSDLDDPAITPRLGLVAALRAARPTDPTLCEGWQARHLAAHIVIRDGDPLAAAKALVQGADAAILRGDAITTTREYETLIDQIEQGPPRWSPLGWSATPNLLEFLVHAEDVRRGVSRPAEPVSLPPHLAAALWRSVKPMARLKTLRSDNGCILVVPGGPRAVVHRGRNPQIVTGSEMELALWVSGREDASLVAVTSS